MAFLQEIECQSCGAPINWDGTYGKTVICTFCGATLIPTATQMEEVWLMTDLVARARYEFNGNLDKLEHDIRYEVMRGMDWSNLDIDYLRQITHLEQQGVIRKLASFWAVSPHPAIYRAIDEGKIILGGQEIPFERGDEIVWACPMTRDRFNLDVPVLVADFNDSKVQRLCGEMTNAMQSRMK
jgi:hypothetical protein